MMGSKIRPLPSIVWGFWTDCRAADNLGLKGTRTLAEHGGTCAPKLDAEQRRRPQVVIRAGVSHMSYSLNSLNP